MVVQRCMVFVVLLFVTVNLLIDIIDIIDIIDRTG